MKVWITKYALTDGILEREFKEYGTGMHSVTVIWPNGLNGVAYFHGSDWHPTLVEAEIHANKMRLKKIASLKKQIERLEKLEF